MNPIVVNGRFLAAKPTGIHRVGRGLIDAARDAGLALEIVAPRGTDDPRVSRHTWAPPGRAGAHAWEQLLLPRTARGRTILSPANTAPVLARNGVVFVHDLAPVVGPHWFRSPGRLYGRLALASAKRARAVLVPSESVLRELVGAGASTATTFVVRPSVDATFRPASDPDVERMRARYGLSRPFLVHVGWADPRKDAATALSAHLRVVEELPHDLVLVGSAHPNFAPVRLPHTPTIRRTGFVTDEEMRALLTAAHGLVLPSRYEGFGLPALEALACGTPVILSDIPVFRETVAGAATYVPVGHVDAWADAFRAALRRDLNPGVAPRHSWRDATAQMIHALESVGCI
jgi:glycosyltransferase involved in cell wall biosynthesis